MEVDVRVGKCISEAVIDRNFTVVLLHFLCESIYDSIKLPSITDAQ